MNINRYFWVKLILLFIGIIIGWTAYAILSDYSIFVLENEISISDVLAIIIDIALACFVIKSIDKGLQNNRVEKDIFISELNSILEILNCLERKCAYDNNLSFGVTVYDIERSKKIFLGLWAILGDRESVFCKNHDKNKLSILNEVRKLNSILTDSQYDSDKSIRPVIIKRNVIHLNGTLKPLIGQIITSIKEDIIRLKIDINQQL